jgi:glycosyltransferase involved in cell wall biosynthesis
VVDDASSDGSAELAARYADLVLRSPGPRAAAATRNLSAERAQSAARVFIEADVSVHPDGAAPLGRDFGSRGRRCRCLRRLRYCATRRDWYRTTATRCITTSTCSPGDAETFWTGGGVIRREVFAGLGGFDETLASLEDIDLGYRARALGHRILLQPDIQGTHRT